MITELWSKAGNISLSGVRCDLGSRPSSSTISCRGSSMEGTYVVDGVRACEQPILNRCACCDLNLETRALACWTTVVAMLVRIQPPALDTKLNGRALVHHMARGWRFESFSVRHGVGRLVGPFSTRSLPGAYRCDHVSALGERAGVMTRCGAGSIPAGGAYASVAEQSKAVPDRRQTCRRDFGKKTDGLGANPPAGTILTIVNLIAMNGGMSSKIVSDFIALGKMLSEANDAAGDLWSWLPSHKVAEKHHGDYAMEFCPAIQDVMREAAMYLGHLKYVEQPLSAEEQEWFNRCPCGESHAGFSGVEES